MKKNSWIIVKSKITYLFLVPVPVGITILIYTSFLFFVDKSIVAGDYMYYVVLVLMVMFLGIYFFARLNSYSALMNPNHPKPNEHQSDN